MAQRQAEDNLRQEARHKDEFLAMLAHELRNPLAPIGSAAELLALGRMNEATVGRASDVMRRQVAHMTSLIDDLLDVSRVTRGLVTLDSLPLELGAVLQEALEQVRPLIDSRHHQLDLQVAAQPAPVAGDRKRLVQVVANLLNNAAKYTRDGGRIDVRLEVTVEHVILRVRDNGVGMSREVQDKAFGLFTQAERTPDRSQGGLGIGLALVKSIAELHRGSITAYSAGLRQGSTFTLCLPRLNQQTPPGPEAAPAPVAGPVRGHSILVVDDNVDAADLLATLLEAMGHTVAVEHGALAALARVQREAPEVLLLDIGLPEMDGNALARRVRALPHMAGATLIALTGYGSPEDRNTAIEAGFDHHLVKPVEIATLMDLLARVG